MGFREIQEKLHEMQVNATGTTGEAIGILLSLTPATLSGLINKVQGGSYTEAAYEVMDVWAARGKKIGREHSDLIVDVLKDAAKHTAMDLAKKKNKSQH